jgi:hypothetical protein
MKIKTMNYYIIPAALAITLLVTLLFSSLSGRPFRGLWLLFILIFLATLSGQLWIAPVGPVTWGIAWVPLIAVALFLTFLLMALAPPPPEVNRTEKPQNEGAFIVLGGFFWLLMILLLIAIIAGYYRSVYLLAE